MKRTALKRTSLRRNGPIGSGLHAMPVRRKGKARRGRFADPGYLAWIRTKPCIACYTDAIAVYGPEILDTEPSGLVEAAHFGLRGLGQKCPGRRAGPLCAGHHRTGKDSHHVLGKRFWEFHNLDMEAIIAWLNAAYERRKR